jgi:lactate dehydrogenase-like 2-hydroxyacid dehydrogenase
VIVGLGRDRLAAGDAAQGVRPSRDRRAAGSLAGADVADTWLAWRGCTLAGAGDFVALTCPLTPATTNLIDAKALAAMKPRLTW